MDVMRHSFVEDDAVRQLDTAIDWGRYAELFEYDATDDHLTIDADGELAVQA